MWDIVGWNDDILHILHQKPPPGTALALNSLVAVGFWWVGGVLGTKAVLK